MKKTKKKVKIKYKKVLSCLVFLCAIIYFIIHLFNINIKNIYIKGNNILSDQEVIDLASLTFYPNSFKNSSWVIEKRIKKNIYIKNVKVSKKLISTVLIDIEEYEPLFYDTNKNKTILDIDIYTDDKFDIPYFSGNIDLELYNELINKMKLLNKNIIDKISEIKYEPSDLDKKRFLLLMNDGNYVYLTIEKFELINNYINIIKNFGDKKGILSLDAGNVFEYFK